MKIVMMGTGPFAVPTFRWLLDSPHEVAALVTRPPKATRGRKPAALSPMHELGLQANVSLLMPEDINSQEAHRQIAPLMAELFVVCDYGQILSPSTLKLAGFGGINLHGSLLPKYRGAAPVQWAVYNGDRETGVSVIHMTPKLDAGPILKRQQVEIDPDETASELEQRLAELGVDCVQASIAMVERDGKQVQGEPQSPAKATKAPRLKKEDGEVDWNRSAGQIKDQVRAFTPWPGAYTGWERRGAIERLILDQVRVLPEATAAEPPGTVVQADRSGLLVATGGGVLEIVRVQPAGKRVMTAAEFLNGKPLRFGDRLQRPSAADVPRATST